MTNQLSQIKWGRVTLTAIVVYAISFVTVFLIITGYASYLAFQARGAPDQAMIGAFADRYGPWIGPINMILCTFLGALWMSRRVETAVQLHGIALGVLVSLVDIIFAGARAFSLDVLIPIILIIGAGWLGSRLAAKK